MVPMVDALVGFLGFLSFFGACAPLMTIFMAAYVLFRITMFELEVNPVTSLQVQIL